MIILYMFELFFISASSYSSEDGLSSNMEHKFIDSYTEGCSSLVHKTSLVRPIPKEEGMVTHLLVFMQRGSNAEKVSLQPESHCGPAQEGLLKMPPQDQDMRVKIPPESVLIAEDPRIKSIMKPQQDVKTAEDRNPDMGFEEKLVKLRGPPVARGKGKNRTQPKKRAAKGRCKCKYISISIDFNYLVRLILYYKYHEISLYAII